MKAKKSSTKVSLRRHGNVMRVNGVTVDMSMNRLINELELLYEQNEAGLAYPLPMWCPAAQFDAIRKEAWRVYGPNGDAWKAQHAAYLEGKERAEYARLKAKYEHA